MTSQSQIRLSKLRCLVVDDDDQVRTVLSRELRLAFEVVSVRGVEEALRAMQESPRLALVVSDYQLEDGDGVDVLRAAQQMMPEARRIMVSGGMSPKQVSEVLTSGHAHQFVAKPWKFGTLLRAAKDLTGGGVVPGDVRSARAR